MLRCGNEELPTIRPVRYSGGSLSRETTHACHHSTAPQYPLHAGLEPTRMEKGRALPADGLIFDLEDAVAPDAKRDGRLEIAKALQDREAYAWRELIVRVNGLDTPWGHADLTAMARAGADAILLPKVEGSDTVRRALHVLALAGAPSSLAIWCMIETPRGVLHVEEIADTEHVQCIVMGTSDLTKDLQAHHTPARLPMMVSLGTCLLAARAARISILDGVHLDLDDEAGFAESATKGAISALTAARLSTRGDRTGQRGIRSVAPRSPGRAGSSRPMTLPGPQARVSSWSTASWSRTSMCSRRAASWRWPR